MNYKHGIAAILFVSAVLFAILLITIVASARRERESNCRDRGGVAVGRYLDLCIDPKVLR